MAKYRLYQAKFEERNEPEDLQHACYLARRRGPKHMASHTSLEDFMEHFYDVTWHGEFNDAKADEDVLEELFREFNIDHPAGFKSYSMSVGDMVDLDGRIYWCAPIGFERVN